MTIADRYTLDREIGRGGMGAVWLGHDLLLGRNVALKRVGVAPGGTSPELARAEREAKLAASLSHANVVSVFDLAHEGDVQWLVMEYVEGTDLAELVRRDGALTPDRAAPVLAQVAAALVAAHAAGVVHRDVKPSNILVTPTGQVKLSDFGIARTKGDASLTQTGLVTGSPAYLSPEVASGRSASERSDVWSLGATAYHAVEGHPPYDIGDNLIGALYRIVHEEPPVPTSPGWLEPLFAATMHRDEEARWSAQQVRDFLEAGPTAAVAAPAGRRSAGRSGRERRGARAAAPAAPVTGGHTQVLSPVGGLADRPDRAPAPPDRSDRPGRRLPLLLSGAAVLVVLLLAVAVWQLLGDRGTTTETATDDPATSAAPPSASPSADAPTAQGMEAFLRDYVQTAATDQAAGFDQLTPAFKQASGGLSGYSDFWGNVSNPEIASLRADPAALTVTYRYSYDLRNGERRTEDVGLQLAYADGGYLIAGPV